MTRADRTFNPPRPPSIGARETVQPAVLQSPLGDGYVLRAPEGINSLLPEPVQLVWQSLSPAQAREILSVFEEQQGVGRLRYEIPGLAPARFWRVTKWQRTPKRGGAVRLDATFEATVL